MKSTVRRDGSASAIPSVAPVAQPIEPHSGWHWTSAPSGSGSGTIPELMLPLSITIRSCGFRKSRNREYMFTAVIGSSGLPPGLVGGYFLGGAEYPKFFLTVARQAVEDVTHPDRVVDPIPDPDVIPPRW